METWPVQDQGCRFQEPCMPALEVWEPQAHKGSKSPVWLSPGTKAAIAMAPLDLSFGRSLFEKIKHGGFKRSLIFVSLPLLTKTDLASMKTGQMYMIFMGFRTSQKLLKSPVGIQYIIASDTYLKLTF